MEESETPFASEHEVPSEGFKIKLDEMVNAFQASPLKPSSDDDYSSPSSTQSTGPQISPNANPSSDTNSPSPSLSQSPVQPTLIPTPPEPTKSPEEEAEELKEQGNTAFKAKSYGTAIDLYTRALELNPKEATYFTNRAASYIGLKRFKPALADCQEAVSLQYPNPSAKTLVRLARCQLALGSASACLTTINEVLEKEPTNQAALQLQFKALQLEGHVRNLTKAKSNKEWAMAGLALGQCIQVTEGDIPIEWRCWRIELELGRRNFDAATAAAVDALRFDSNSADVVALRGLVLFLTAELSAALKHAMSALRLDPDHSKAKNLRIRVKAVERLKEEGNNLFKSSRWEDAVEKYGEALDVVGAKDEEGGGGQMRATLLSNRATSLLKLKRHEEALSDTNASLLLYKASFKALRTRARIYLHMEKYDESIADFKEAIEQVKMDGNSSDERSLASELRKAEAALKRSKTKDYYKILGIARDCTEVEIKKAYRRESLKHHPDKGGDEEKFKLVVEAHAVLSDPHRRERYDNGMDEDGTTESRGGFGGGFGGHGMSPEDYADIFGQFGGFQFRQGPGSQFGF